MDQAAEPQDLAIEPSPRSQRHTMPRPAAWSAARDFWELAKPEIALSVTISGLAGFLLGSEAGIELNTLALTLVGTALCAGAGGALNHFVERKHDALMRRTVNRPLPAGRVTPVAALGYGAILATLGLSALWFTNLLTTGLAALTLVLYLGAYTPLKRRTHYNTLVGTIPGALPALGGYTAATGTFGMAGWVVFAILALWQMPHFLALAWMYRKDYARARYAMLPVVHPDGHSTAQQLLLTTVALVAVSTLPTAIGNTGWTYLVGALILGAWLVVPAWAFYRSRSHGDARRVLKASIYYVPVLVALICADRWLL